MVMSLRIPSSGFGASSNTAGSNAVESTLQRATDSNAAFLNEAKDLYSPYLQGGMESLAEYQKLLLGGIDNLAQNDQNFTAMRELGNQNVMANRAVSGMLRSGATADTLYSADTKFMNDYYGNRLNQLLTGVNDVGKYGTQGTSSALQALGTNQTDLANALANIKIAREGMASNERAAELSAATSRDLAKNTGGLFGSGGLLGLGI